MKTVKVPALGAHIRVRNTKKGQVVVKEIAAEAARALLRFKERHGR